MQINILKKKYNGAWHENYDLTNATWLKIKNTFCKYMWFPESTDDIANFIKNEKSLPYIILGNGSNVMLGDFQGMVINMARINVINFTDNSVIVGAGVSNAIFIINALKRNLGGLEFLYTIPGTIGGSTYMNAGAHGDCISNHIEWVEAIDLNGNVEVLKKNDIIFDYRYSSLQLGYIVTKVCLNLIKVDYDESAKKISQYKEYVELKQPRFNTAGSTFRNPKNCSAWSLIAQLDDKDLSHNGAYFSPLHRNFIINSGDATVEDIYYLANSVKDKVYQKTGIDLEFEVKIFI